MNKKFIRPFDSGAHTFFQNLALVNQPAFEQRQNTSAKPRLKIVFLFNNNDLSDIHKTA